MLSPRQGSEGKPGLKALRILVVEDQYLIAMEVQESLEKAGAKVIGPVGRLEHAVNTAQKENVDAALLDIDLHGERCWQVADILAQKAVPFVFATGFATGIVMPERFAGCAVLSKPYRERDMLEALRKLLGARA